MKSLKIRALCSVCLVLAAALALAPANAQKLTGPGVRYFVDCTPPSACTTFDRPHNLVRRATGSSEAPEGAIRRSIVSSKILFSGTMITTMVHEDCTKYEWFVVTQAEESSSVLIYNPVDIGSEFCGYTESDDGPVREPHTLYLLLPIHVLWAEITGYEIKRGDSFHKPPSSIPAKATAACDPPTPKKPQSPAPPPPNIALCDQNDWPMSWFYATGPVYNRLTPPGTGQGAISFTPVIGSGTQSLSFDVQAAPSGRLGHGWLGVPFVFEKSGSQNANLNSLTGAISYELHPERGGNILPHRGRGSVVVWPASIRDVQFQVRSGVEFAPTTPHDLNTLEAEALKLPLVFTIHRQPSALTLYPLFGLEQVHHVDTHLAGEQPWQYRELAGGDASLRWPYNALKSLLGDKPITIDFSYRYRWLSHPEPTTNYQGAAPKTTPPEYLSAESHSYTRATYNAPISSYLTFKVTVQHGALPPDFRSLGYTLQLGLSFSDPGSSEH